MVKLWNILKYKYYRLRWKYPDLFPMCYPIHVDIEITSYCNAKCGFCPHSDDKVEFKKDYMGLINFRKIIDQIAGKVPSIKLNLRGEPTIHGDIIPMLDYVKGKFVDVRINTNAILTKPEVIKKIVEVCDNISVSVNAYNAESFSRSFGIDTRDAWRKQEHNINIIRDEMFFKNMFIKKQPTQLTLSFVDDGTHGNQMREYAEDYTESLNKNERIFYRKATDRTGTGDTKRKRKNCMMPMRRLSIAVNGDVYPCCVMWHKPFIVLGNIFKGETIKKIWWSKKTQELRFMLEKISQLTHSNSDGEYDKTISIAYRTTGNRIVEKSKKLYKACINCGSEESYV